MYFHSFSELMEMGGHGIYVWSAYGSTVILISYMIISPLIRKKSILIDIEMSESIANSRKKGDVRS